MEHQNSPVRSSTQITTSSSDSARFDRVVFLNDVFFCPWNVLRLLGHTLEEKGNGEGRCMEWGGMGCDWIGC